MPPCPSPLGLDVLRATLGPALAAPYARAFGPVPWLTAGTLTWAADDAPRVAAAWTLGRRAARGGADGDSATGALLAVDLALTGDPAGAQVRTAPLRALAPIDDTVGTASPAVLTCRAGGAPAPLVCVTRRSPPGLRTPCSPTRRSGRPRRQPRRPPQRRLSRAAGRGHRGRRGACARRRRPRGAAARAARAGPHALTHPVTPSRAPPDAATQVRTRRLRRRRARRRRTPPQSACAPARPRCERGARRSPARPARRPP